MKRLILFDIDETMLHSDGVGRRALEAALTEFSGKRISMDGMTLSGKTDPQICREALTAHDFTDDQVTAMLPELFVGYLPRLQREVAKSRDMTLHKGVIELLQELAVQPWARLGLLTGNIEPAARIKLEPFDINHYFGTGAYGSDSHDRMHLPAIAHKRANEHFQEDFTPDEMVIIGDAVNDVLCARGYGVKSIAVATGRTKKQDLENLDPHYVFDHLGDTAAVIAAISSI